MDTDSPALWTLLTETTFMANVVGLGAIGHVLEPDPDVTQALFGILGILVLSLAWMRRFADLDLRRPRSHDARP